MTELDYIRVIIADDHPVVRNGIRFSLLALNDIEMVGEAGCGTEALRLCYELRPDVLLIDLNMPDLNGIACTRAIRKHCPQTQVIALTSFWEVDVVRQMLQAGAIGYLLKNMPLDELVLAIRQAHAGHSTLAPVVAQSLVDFTAAAPPFEPGRDLSERERETLALLAEGLSNAGIAARLSISPSTARFHVSNILTKLGAANRAQAAALAVKHRLAI